MVPLPEWETIDTHSYDQLPEINALLDVIPETARRPRETRDDSWAAQVSAGTGEGEAHGPARAATTARSWSGASDRTAWLSSQGPEQQRQCLQAEHG
jgi:hypothetical protein